MANQLQNIKISQAKSVKRGVRRLPEEPGDEAARFEPTNDITIEADLDDVTSSTTEGRWRTMKFSDCSPVQTINFKYPRILRYVASTPWAMEPSRLADVLDVLKFKASGGQLSKAEIREYCGIQAAHSEEPRSGAVAVVPLHGIISHHIRQVQDISGPGGTSVEGFRKDLRAALSADEVGSVVIDIDSPGGSVEGVQELADEILSLRGDKPIVAVANAMAASAAFWIGSAADEFSVIPSGQVGSIGVFAAHEDISQRLEDEGVKITLVHAGKFKVEGNPFQALSEEAEAHIQERVDATFDKFVDAVASGRGVTIKTVENDFGQGRLVDADEALATGMVDRIETLEQAITRMRGVRSKGSMRAEMDLRRQALAFP